MELDAAFVTVVVDDETDILPSPNPGTPKPPEIAGLVGRPGVRGAIEAVGDRCRRRVADDSPCSYNEDMGVATSTEVGIRELKNGLSKYLERVRAGEEVIVTDRGRPVARLSTIDESTDRLADLVAAGVVRAPTQKARRRPGRRIEAEGSVSDLVSEQRR